MRGFLLLIALYWTTNGYLISSLNNWKQQKFYNYERRIYHDFNNKFKEKHISVQLISNRFLSITSARSGGDREDYINKPLPALVLTRRLAEDWTSLASMARATLGASLSHLGLLKVRWPFWIVVDLAASTVMRTQWTYKLDITSLSFGLSPGNKNPINITATDCLGIAKEYFLKERFHEADEWLQKALNLLHNSDDVSLRGTVLYYRAAALCCSGDRSNFQNIIRRILKEHRHSKCPEELAEVYEIIGSYGCVTSNKEITSLLHFKNYLAGSETFSFFKNVEVAEHRNKLCRGEVMIDCRRLRCRYVHYGQPHLRLQPFKLEELQLDPPVLRFYDVITNSEAETLIQEAMLKLGPAFVGGDTAYRRVSDARTSRLAEFPSKSNYWVDLRIAEVTRLYTRNPETYKIARYIVSEEFLPHWDHMSGMKRWEEDRIATVMIYLSDVEQGGNTVFNRWNLSVPPVKNSAILWFNHKPSGEHDMTSQHSGCPVLKGTKWIFNKFVHNLGNHENFPCTLDKDGSFKYFYL